LDTTNFDTLREHLTNDFTWPSVYMFKFIAPAENRIFALLHDLFPHQAEFTNRHSAGGKYVSITVKEMMLSADEVIERYQKASAIEGVIVL
jgi:putative lipoic acid-binding regulatory protein